MSVDQSAHIIIADRLKHAGERVYSRGRPDHPPFKSARVAAANLLRVLRHNMPLLVMRDRSLYGLRELLLERDWPVIITNRAGDCAYRLPPSALFDARGQRIPLHVEPLPRGSRPYTGEVAAVVVGCLAFDPRRRQLSSFDADRTAGILSDLYDGSASGFHLDASTPIIALAHDVQEVTDWPDPAFGFTQADVVVTPTRAVVLGSGEVISLSTHMEIPHVH